MTGPRDVLRAARLEGKAALRLVFADNRSFLLPVGRIGMPVDRIKWNTAEPSHGGTSMTVTGIKNDPVPIDSGTLRYLVDKTYADEMDAALRAIQFSDEELDRIVRDNRPPAEWYAQPSRDLTRPSWK